MAQQAHGSSRAKPCHAECLVLTAWALAQAAHGKTAAPYGPRCKAATRNEGHVASPARGDEKVVEQLPCHLTSNARVLAEENLTAHTRARRGHLVICCRGRSTTLVVSRTGPLLTAYPARRRVGRTSAARENGHREKSCFGLLTSDVTTRTGGLLCTTDRPRYRANAPCFWKARVVIPLALALQGGRACILSNFHPRKTTALQAMRLWEPGGLQPLPPGLS